MDLSDPAKLPCLDFVQDALNSQGNRNKAKLKAQAALQDIESDLKETDWWNEGWLDGVLISDRPGIQPGLRTLAQSISGGHEQQKVQHTIIKDASRSVQDKRQAERSVSGSQKPAGTTDRSEQISFNPISIRIAILPVRVFCPGTASRACRFQLISPPGASTARMMNSSPGRAFWRSPSLVRARLSITKAPAISSIRSTCLFRIRAKDLPLTRAKQCPVCGYLHPITNGDGSGPLRALWMPYWKPHLTISFACRMFPPSAGTASHPMKKSACARGLSCEPPFGLPIMAGQSLPGRQKFIARRIDWQADLRAFGDAVADQSGLAPALPTHNSYGFILDTERGYWARNKDDNDTPPEMDDPMSPRTMRVVPFVEDHKNCLLFEPMRSIGGRADGFFAGGIEERHPGGIPAGRQRTGCGTAAHGDERRSIFFMNLPKAAQGFCGGWSMIRVLLPGLLPRHCSCATSIRRPARICSMRRRQRKTAKPPAMTA